MITNENEPCLVETAQGFSVKYKEKFLYSKYNPAKAICQKIDQMDILPGTIFLAFSPVLSYGLKELEQKLPPNCIIFLCEADKELRQFSEKFYEKKVDCSTGKIISLSEREMFNLPVIIQKPLWTFENGMTVLFAGNFRRVIKIDFSAGVQFHQDFYNRLEEASVHALKQFWTNRFTLAKFGRKYSRNMFRNLQTIEETKPLSKWIGQIERPIFVFGAGESAERGISEIKKKRNPFVLCADTAFSMLTASGIVPDGVVVDEAQSVIAQSFIGVLSAAKNGTQVFQSLCSVPHVAGKNFPKDHITFYGTEYASSSFFDNLKKQLFFPPVMPAFGSVGISAFILAFLLRKNENVPVRFYGLDFAYSTGKTHAKGTTAHKRQLVNKTRIKAMENLGACYGANVLKLPEGSPFKWTTPVLAGYAETFLQVQTQVSDIVKEIMNSDIQNKINAEKCTVQSFLETEKEALVELRDLLSGKEEMPEKERAERIKSLLENRQYLYLHFPDGYKLSMELNFLKRIRGEIEGFLKVI